MSVRNCPTDLSKESQSITGVESLVITEVSDRFSFDMLHHEVRQAVAGRTATVQARDVRMFKIGENLPFHQETSEHRIRVHAALDQFEGDALREALAAMLGEEHNTHSAFADLFEDKIIVDFLTGEVLFQSIGPQTLLNYQRGTDEGLRFRVA